MEYLMMRDLSDKTIKLYMMYYNNFPHAKPLDQNLLNKFILKYGGHSVVRSFVIAFLSFLNNKDLEVIKKTGRKKKRLIKILSMDDVNKLAQGLYDSNYKYGLMFELLFHLAIRREEITTMKISWFDWDVWEKDMKKPCRVNVIGKNNKERPLILSPFVMNKVYNYVKQGLDEKTLNLNNRMFNMGEHRFWEIIRDHSIKILGKRIRLHEVRHTRATLWRDQGVPVEEIKERLGHESLQTTQVYLHIDQDNMLKVWEKEYT